MTTPLEKVEFFSTPAHDCSYLAGRTATTLFADPNVAKNTHLYTLLSQRGFRRSGEQLYRPSCRGCHACIPVRIPARDFSPNRRQRRAWKKNQDLHIIAKPPIYDQAHFELYTRYLSKRHRQGGMDNPSPDGYMDFLTSTWSDTIFYEMRLADKLLGVAVVDQLRNSLSAVYTFFEPDMPERSLGRFAVLHEIFIAAQLQLDWVYLGYWIKGCAKMRYKNEFQPIEYYVNGRWQSDLGLAQK